MTCPVVDNRVCSSLPFRLCNPSTGMTSQADNDLLLLFFGHELPLPPSRSCNLDRNFKFYPMRSLRSVFLIFITRTVSYSTVILRWRLLSHNRHNLTTFENGSVSKCPPQRYTVVFLTAAITRSVSRRITRLDHQKRKKMTVKTAVAVDSVVYKQRRWKGRVEERAV